MDRCAFVGFTAATAATSLLSRNKEYRSINFVPSANLRQSPINKAKRLSLQPV
jgi:hypothetical protein